MYYRKSVGVIIVYDISVRESFEHVTDWLAEAEANISGPDPTQCVFLLVGNKADLQAERKVLYEEGEYLAKHRNLLFIETSLITCENVDVNFFYKAKNIFLDGKIILLIIYLKNYYFLL